MPVCCISAILKASDFSELDRQECLFSTTATVLDNGTQVRKSLGFFLMILLEFISFVCMLMETVSEFQSNFSCQRKIVSLFAPLAKIETINVYNHVAYNYYV